MRGIGKDGCLTNYEHMIGISFELLEKPMKKRLVKRKTRKNCFAFN